MLKIFYIIIAIVLLGFIVTVHEFGHYLVGRLTGIGVVEFAVGFGPKIIGWKRKGIQYSLRAIPLGGYCRFAGEDEENPAPNVFNNVPVWKRFLTMLAGPAMNFVLAFVSCVILLSSFYVAEYQPRISEIDPNMPAAESGLELGDIVTSINGTDISYDEEGILTLQQVFQTANLEQELEMTIDRGGEEHKLMVLPQRVVDEENGTVTYMLGISFGGRPFTIVEAVKESWSYMVDVVKLLLESLKNLFFRGEGTEDMMGTVGIISFASDLISDEKLYAVVNLLFIISLNLGIMNLLPLPALDGGRLVFLIIEGIRRKPLPPEKEGMVHAAGFLLLLAAFIFFTYQDIMRLIAGG
ncbi:MAG: site-2 protease family protein [Clostridia bacterium]|nr:site-2 protease family protein [Clostridia bacterium]